MLSERHASTLRAGAVLSARFNAHLGSSTVSNSGRPRSRSSAALDRCQRHVQSVPAWCSLGLWYAARAPKN